VKECYQKLGSGAVAIAILWRYFYFDEFQLFLEDYHSRAGGMVRCFRVCEEWYDCDRFYFADNASGTSNWIGSRRMTGDEEEKWPIRRRWLKRRKYWGKEKDQKNGVWLGVFKEVKERFVVMWLHRTKVGSEEETKERRRI